MKEQTEAGGRIVAIRQMRYNDDEILRKRCKEVKEVDDKIRVMLDDMLDTLRHTENGAALATNQVGILKRLVVIEYCGELLKLVNRGLPEFPRKICEYHSAAEGDGTGPG